MSVLPEWYHGAKDRSVTVFIQLCKPSFEETNNEEKKKVSQSTGCKNKRKTCMSLEYVLELPSFKMPLRIILLIFFKYKVSIHL